METTCLHSFCLSSSVCVTQHGCCSQESLICIAGVMNRFDAKCLQARGSPFPGGLFITDPLGKVLLLWKLVGIKVNGNN